MEAMILAAGKGTRLAPWTDTMPKALVTVAGRPLLDWVADKLAAAGATRIIVNVHRHQEQFVAWLEGRPPEGPEIVLSPEPDGPYDTGGGLLHAAPFFRAPTPFLVHNVDVFSAIPLAELIAAHLGAAGRGGEEVLATLAVQQRNSSRRLLFDELGLFAWEGQWESQQGEGRVKVREPVGTVRPYAFAGIQVVEPRIFRLTSRKGAFSIVALYLDLAAAGYRILPHDVTGVPWIDVGTPTRLRAAEALIGRFHLFDGSAPGP